MYMELLRRSEVMRQHRLAGGGVAAVLPVHYPRALLRAFGILPVEVWGPPGKDASSAGAYLQAYTCSVVHSGLSFLTSSVQEQIDCVLVPHTCDSLQGLGSLLIDLVRPKVPVLTLYHPRGEASAAKAFLRDELASLYQQLAELTGKRPDDAALLFAIQREEAADTLFAELLAARAYLPYGNREFYRLLRSREYLPAEDYCTLAKAILAERGERPQAGIPILLSGMMPEPAEVLDVLSEASALVVADDLACSGRRIYSPGKSREPLLRMAESLLNSPADSTRGVSIAARLQHIESLVEAKGARAAVLFLVKFCEPEQFYLPAIRAALEARGVPTVAVEVDVGEPLPQQAVTRLQALVEMAA